MAIDFDKIQFAFQFLSKKNPKRISSYSDFFPSNKPSVRKKLLKLFILEVILSYDRIIKNNQQNRIILEITFVNIWSDLPNNRLLAEISLWSADFTRLGEEIQRIDPFADLYHIDVSDGHFVPGFLFFADLVAAMRPLSKKKFHIHLMTTNPQDHIDDFVLAGADIITVHTENGLLAPAALGCIRQKNIGSGLAVGLDTDPKSIVPFIDLIDVITMMGTALGVKGVEPSPLAFERIKTIRRLVDEAGYHDKIKVMADGGIRTHTVPLLRAAGADGIVMGSLAFKSTDLQKTFDWVHSLPVENK
jgi:ribulose-phosphate 3-epimerase